MGGKMQGEMSPWSSWKQPLGGVIRRVTEGGQVAQGWGGGVVVLKSQGGERGRLYKILL